MENGRGSGLACHIFFPRGFIKLLLSARNGQWRILAGRASERFGGGAKDGSGAGVWGFFAYRGGLLLEVGLARLVALVSACHF